VPLGDRIEMDSVKIAVRNASAALDQVTAERIVPRAKNESLTLSPSPEKLSKR